MRSRFEDHFNRHAMPANERAFGVPVLLVRGSLTSEPITARRNEISSQSMGAEIGIDYKIERRDFLLPIATTMLNGQSVRPRAGDRIIEGDRTWEVFFPDDSTPASERVAGSHDWLVHTRIDEEACDR